MCLSLQVAVFLVDTEGCLDLQRPMETSIKLSVFSILLSSYWVGAPCCRGRDWGLRRWCHAAGSGRGGSAGGLFCGEVR